MVLESECISIKQIMYDKKDVWNSFLSILVENRSDGNLVMISIHWQIL